MLLDQAAAHVPLQVQVVDIQPDPVLHKLFADHVPVADFGEGERLYWPFGLDDVLGVLNGTVRADKPPARPAVTGRARDLVIFIDKAIYRFARHWVAVIAFVMALYAGLPALAPILMANSYAGPANLIYSAYRFACHQLPSRSYFIFGQQMAYCHRDTAIYTALFLSIVIFGLVRHRIKPLPLPAYALFVAPMALDGLTQLVGLRVSSWQLRTVTGALFGIGSGWLALPYLEEAFQDIRQSVNAQLSLEQS